MVKHCEGIRNYPPTRPILPHGGVGEQKIESGVRCQIIIMLLAHW